MDHRSRVAAIAGALVAGTILAGCAATLNHPHNTITAVPSTDGVQHVKVVAHSFWFEPDSIVVRAGVPVELKLVNASWIVPHNFSMRAPDAGVEVHQNISWPVTVRFTVREPGTYAFFCHEDKHAGKGMTGTLTAVK